MMARTTGDNAPVTVGSILKWGSTLFVLGSALVGVTLYAAGLRGEARDELAPVKTQVTIATRDIAELKVKDEIKTNKINEMDKKLDTMLTIVQRIDEKVGKP